jgi:poly(A) polymerase
MHKILEILKEDKPYDTLLQLSSNELIILFPELNALNVNENGHKNNFIHTMGVLKNVCDANLSYNIKIVTLFHDIGKAKTGRVNENGKWTFHNHEQIGAEMSRKILVSWNVEPTLIDYIVRMVDNHGRVKIHRDVTESAIRRLTKDVGYDIIFDLIEFCKCDITTKFQDKRDRIVTSLNTIKDRIIEIYANDEAAKWRSPLTGDIIMKTLNIGQCRLVGDIKKEYDPLFKENLITLEDAINQIKLKYENNLFL